MIQKQTWKDEIRILITDEENLGSVQISIPLYVSDIFGKADALIYALFVDNNHRRNGVAKRLLQYGCVTFCEDSSKCKYRNKFDHRIVKAEKIAARYSRKLMNCLTRLAGKTPFEIGDILGSSNKLKKYDYETRNAKINLKDSNSSRNSDKTESYR